MSMDDLDDLFAQARNARPEPSAALMSRVADDAKRHQPDALQDMRHAGTRAGGGMFAQVLSVLGGWPAVAGLASAAVVGVWIGIDPPTELIDPVSLALGSSELSDLLSPSDSFDFTQFEG